MNRRLLGLIAGVGVVTLATWPGGRPRSASADDGAPSVSVSASSQITDGQAVTITVRTNGSTPVYEARALLCRSGVEYQGSTTSFPNVDAAPDGANCPGPSHPISSSGDQYVTDSNTLNNAPTSDGEAFQFRIGSGVVNWPDATHNSQQASLTCDGANPCSLVVEVRFTPGGGVKQWRPFVIPITYGVADPIAGCGGPADGALDTGGADRMQDAWVAWTLASCSAHPDVHAPTRASFLGEGAAVSTFATGGLDLAYTAGGYDRDMALVPPDGNRAAVAVPVAIGATVLSVGGGVPVDSTHKTPYKDIKMQPDEIAAMVSGGVSGMSQSDPDLPASGPHTYADAVKARNPELAKSSDLFDSSAGMAVGAYADAEASSWYATRFLHTLAPDAWKVPDLNQFGEDRSQPRGTDAALALAHPSFAQALTLLSGRPALRKALIGPGPNSSGGVWVLTDLETASALSLTPVQVASGSAFVAPTSDALYAAVAAMHPDDQGILVSDPSNTTANGGAQPYPMTFVEYALAPAEPLVADDCSPRAASQKLLTDWLTYITGDGQAKLPPGLLPLTPDLQARAAEAIKKVGAAAVTGDCADVAESTATTDAGASGGAAAPDVSSGTAASDSTGLAAPPSAPASSSPSSAAPISTGSLPRSSVARAALAVATAPLTQLASPAPLASVPNVLDTVAGIAIPRFLGRSLPKLWGPIVALVGIAGLCGLSMFVTSRAR